MRSTSARAVHQGHHRPSLVRAVMPRALHITSSAERSDYVQTLRHDFRRVFTPPARAAGADGRDAKPVALSSRQVVDCLAR